jgi:hypothetical protein
MSHQPYEQDRFENDETFASDEDLLNEFVDDCGDPNCCMNFAPHSRGECYTPEMYESAVRTAERGGKRCADGDWPGDKEPGGNDCEDCGCIVIGSDGRPFCKVCSDAHDASAQRRSGD